MAETLREQLCRVLPIDPDDGTIPVAYDRATGMPVWGTPTKLLDDLIGVLATWLHGEARDLRRLAADAKDRRDDGDPNAERHLQRFLAQAVALEERARALTEGEERP